MPGYAKFSSKWDSPLRPWHTLDVETWEPQEWCYEIEMPGCCRKSAVCSGVQFQCAECGRMWDRGKKGKESIGGLQANR